MCRRHSRFCPGIFRGASWGFRSLCVPAVQTLPPLPMHTVDFSSEQFLVFCFWRRHVSWSKLCSRGSEVPASPRRLWGGSPGHLTKPTGDSHPQSGLGTSRMCGPRHFTTSNETLCLLSLNSPYAQIPEVGRESESEITQSCLTLCRPHAPGSSVHGIFQARVPEWVAISFSRGSSQPGD